MESMGAVGIIGTIGAISVCGDSACTDGRVVSTGAACLGASSRSSACAKSAKD